MAEPLATRLQNKCAENVIDSILDQYATCRSSVVLRFRHTQGIYKELGEELRNTREAAACMPNAEDRLKRWGQLRDEACTT